jgi:hypothetical protein
MTDDTYQPNALFNLSIGLNANGTAKSEAELDTEAALEWEKLSSTMRKNLVCVVALFNAGASGAGMTKSDTAPLIRRKLVEEYRGADGFVRCYKPTALGCRVAAQDKKPS